MAKELQIGDIVGIYEVLGTGALSKGGRKQVRVRCTCCGLEKDARPVHLTATVCTHKKIIIPKYCECCGKLIPYDDKTRPAEYERRIFCSSSCAAKVNNKRQHSDESKIKASEAMLAYYYGEDKTAYEAKLAAKQQGLVNSLSARKVAKYYVDGLIEGHDYVVCPYCALRFGQIQVKHLALHDKSIKDLYIDFGDKYKVVSDKTYHKKTEAGRAIQQKLLDSGTHKGWRFRNITSFAEQFWINVLDTNGIFYEREFPIWHGSANYFLDFKLDHNGKLIDLEIDGKQHKYEDRAMRDKIRDDFMRSAGYIVYRIPWNEISSEQGKSEMQQKINDFLEFYNSL